MKSTQVWLLTVMVLAALVCWVVWFASADTVSPEQLEEDAKAAESIHVALASLVESRMQRVDVSSADPVGAAPGGEVVAEPATDEEWDSFPRSNGPRVPKAFFYGGTLSFGPKNLYRHRSLNATDRYIPKELRDQFAEIYEEKRFLVAEAEHVLSQAVASEAQRLIKAGRIKPVVFKETPEAQAMKKEWEEKGSFAPTEELFVNGDKFLQFFGNGKAYYGVTCDHSPALRPLWDYVVFLRVDWATYVVQWFDSRELMTAPSRASYETKLLATQERMQR